MEIESRRLQIWGVMGNWRVQGFFFFFFFGLCLWVTFEDLSSPTRNWIWATAVKALNPKYETTRELPVQGFFGERGWWKGSKFDCDNDCRYAKDHWIVHFMLANYMWILSLKKKRSSEQSACVFSQKWIKQRNTAFSVPMPLNSYLKTLHPVQFPWEENLPQSVFMFNLSIYFNSMCYT